MYQPTDECSKCKGRCCKWFPGTWSPDDFQDIESELLDLIIQGKATIATHDRWLFPHPVITTNTFVGPCIFLSPTGCTLEWEKRPYECRMLEPQPGQKCIKHGINIREKWINHQHILELLREIEYERKENHRWTRS